MDEPRWRVALVALLLIALLTGFARMQSAQMPPRILFIAREPVLAGREAVYRPVEEETARLSARLGCPHPYLAMESLTGTKEVWWFNGFDSPEEQKEVAEAYEKDTPFTAMIRKNMERKASAIGKVSQAVARYRGDLSGSAPWIPGHARFVVIAVTKDPPSGAATVFQADDGTFFTFSPARTREQADHIAAAIPNATIAVTRPAFSFPAGDWVAADPRFWRADGR